MTEPRVRELVIACRRDPVRVTARRPGAHADSGGHGGGEWADADRGRARLRDYAGQWIASVLGLIHFDPQRRAVFLAGGDKAGKWSNWYKTAISQAEQAHLELEEKK